MRSFIVGTAGHIDHGKSALVEALTGTDPDRLKEEKERGITIELGFAHSSLAEGIVASFIDVPGHERFVRTMLAGAHGIDAVMLVIAADESVMPQTREHFDICRLLGIPRGLVVLTKCDAADPESQALAELEARELVAGTFLAGETILRVSAKSGAGLERLREQLARLARLAAPRSSAGLLRLPIDRVFTLRGFGTVVTGTLVAGSLAEADEVEILPSLRRARVRGLQVHGQGAPRVEAGHRVAVNLAGVEVAGLSRGHVIVHPDTLRKTSLLDVSLSLLDAARPLQDQARVRVHLASAELLARVRLLGRREIAPGSEAIAQLRLETPTVAVRGDRLILRSYSPATTIAGASVLDPLPPKRRLAERDFVERLAQASEPGAAALLVEQADARGVSLRELCARFGQAPETMREVLSKAAGLVALGGAGEEWIAALPLARVRSAALAVLERFHRGHPLEDAMPRDELRRQAEARASAAVFERVVADLVASGEARQAGDGVGLKSHAVRLAPAEQSASEVLAAGAARAGLEGIVVAELARAQSADAKLYEQVARLLEKNGLLRRVGEGRLLTAERLDELASEVRRRWPPGTRLDVGGFKELTGLSRKFVIPLLEYLDRQRVTRRSGAERFVLP